MEARKTFLLTGGLMIATYATADVPLADPSRIPPSSIELERRVEPWCPGDCAVGVPFVIEYRRGRQHLVFVGAHHAFDPQSPTMRAVADGYARLRPKILIVEGFPTAMGESPAMIAAQARRYGAPDGDEFTRSEMTYAISLALKRGVPFLGGEPTRAEAIEAVEAAGASEDDIAFGGMAGIYSQALRAVASPRKSRSLANPAPPRASARSRRQRCRSMDRVGAGHGALPFARAIEDRSRCDMRFSS